jgi:hypothetical protein
MRACAGIHLSLVIAAQARIYGRIPQAPTFEQTPLDKPLLENRPSLPLKESARNPRPVVVVAPSPSREGLGWGWGKSNGIHAREMVFQQPPKPGSQALPEASEGGVNKFCV